MRRHFLPHLSGWAAYRHNPAKNFLRLTNSSDNYKKKFKMEHLNQNLAAALVTSFEIPYTACSPRADSQGMRKTSPGSPLSSDMFLKSPLSQYLHLLALQREKAALLPHTTAFTKAVTRTHHKSCPQAHCYKKGKNNFSERLRHAQLETAHKPI